MILTTTRRVVATSIPRHATFRPTTSPTLFKIGSAFSTQVDPIKMGAAKDFVEKEIKENDILVFSKTYCPYCRSAKNVLNQYTDALKVWELDEMDDGSDIQAYLAEKTGQRTVPSIWLKQQFIGGSSDLQALSPADIKKRIQG